MVQELPHFKDLQFLADHISTLDGLCVINNVSDYVKDNNLFDELEFDNTESCVYSLLYDSIDSVNEQGYQILYVFSKVIERVNKKFNRTKIYYPVCDISKRIYGLFRLGNYEVESVIRYFTEFEFHKIYDGLRNLEFDFNNSTYNLIEIFDYYLNYPNLDITTDEKTQKFVEFIDDHITENMIMLLDLYLPYSIKALYYNVPEEIAQKEITRIEKKFEKFMGSPFK